MAKSNIIFLLTTITLCYFTVMGCSTDTKPRPIISSSTPLPPAIGTNVIIPTLVPMLAPITPTLAYTPTSTRNPSSYPDYHGYSDELTSPDGNWVAILTPEYYSEDGKAYIKIYDSSETLVLTIPSDLGEFEDLIAPRPSLRIHHWSPNSDLFYYYYSFGWEGAATLIDGYGLTELNIVTGEQKALLPDGFVDFSFSPQHTQLAYIFKGLVPTEIVIRDLLTGVERKAPLPISDQLHQQAGWINWAKDGKSLIFFMVKSFINYQIYYMEIEHMKPKLLYEDTWVDWISSSWIGEHLLVILVFNNDGKLIEFNMTEGKILGVVTVTPPP